MKYQDIEPIDGMQSPIECLDSIVNLASSMRRDQNEPEFNSRRIASMRSLLDLFEEYNNKMEAVK